LVLDFTFEKNVWSVVGLGLSFKKSGLDLDRKIRQSAHLWSKPVVVLPHLLKSHCYCDTVNNVFNQTTLLFTQYKNTWHVSIRLCKLVGYTFLSLRFSSEFLVSTKCETIFAVASFRNLSAKFFKPAWCSIVTIVSCPIVLPTYSSTSHCLRQFCESV